MVEEVWRLAVQAEKAFIPRRGAKTAVAERAMARDEATLTNTIFTQEEPLLASLAEVSPFMVDELKSKGPRRPTAIHACKLCDGFEPKLQCTPV